MKNFYIDNIIEKVVYQVFYIYFFWLYSLFLIYVTKIKLVLIHYLCREMLINVLIVADILANNSKY